MADTFSFDELFELANRAGLVDRKRLHWNLHSSYESASQILFNCIQCDSYIRPHRHLKANKDEYLFAVQGSFALVLFDEDGSVKSFKCFGTIRNRTPLLGDLGVKIESSEWHTVLALEANSILLEVKNGPFVPSEAKEYADWSPKEGSQDSATWLKGILRRLFGP
jgi:cupin fold WbuC family metalloprotein